VSKSRLPGSTPGRRRVTEGVLGVAAYVAAMIVVGLILMWLDLSYLYP